MQILSFLILLTITIKRTTGFVSYSSDDHMKCYYDYDEVNYNRRNPKGFPSEKLKKPEKRFLSVSGNAEDVEIKLELALPFIRIPVGKKGGIELFGAENREGRSLGAIDAKVNLAAVAFVGLASLVVTGFGYAFVSLYKLKPYGRKGLKENSVGENSFFTEFSEAPVTSVFSKVIESMDSSLSKYSIDGTSCFQRMVCDKVRAAASHNHNENKLDALITAVTHSEWAMKFVSGTAIEYAIEMAKDDKDCSEIFNRCTLSWPLGHSEELSPSLKEN